MTTSLQHPHLVHSLTYTIDKLVGTGEVLETPNTANNSGPIVMPDDELSLYRLQLIQEFCDKGALTPVRIASKL